MSEDLQDVVNRLRMIRRGEGCDPLMAGPGATGSCERCLPPLAREEFLRSDLLWQGRGEMLKPGSRTTVTRIECAGVPYVLKQYKRVSLRRRLRYAVMRTRSIQSWEQGRLMAELGLPVARPLAILVERRGGIPGRSALLMEASEGDSIRHLVANGDRARLEAAAPHLRAFFARMAACHLVHGDLSGSNILLDGENRPTLIDFDGSLFLRSAWRFRRALRDERIAFLKNFRDHPELEEFFRDVL